MKNMKVKMKLMTSFAILVAMAILVAVIGSLGMNSINNADDDLYTYNVLAISAMGEIRENLQSQRVITRNAIIHAGDREAIQGVQQQLKDLEAQMDAAMATYEKSITDVSEEDAYYNAKSIYESEYNTIKQDIINGALNSFEEGLAAQERPEVVSATNEMVAGFTTAMDNNDTWAHETVENNTSLFKTMFCLELGVLVVAVLVAVFLTFYISSLISKPLGAMAAALEQIGTKGDLELSPEMAKSASECATWKDEIGMCARAVGGMIGHLLDVEKDLARVADGDLTVSVKTLSDRDNIGISVSKLIDSLNGMFGEINSATNQVSIGSKQIADGAQSLAQGSTEQASAVQQLSASISEIAEKTKENAQMATQAATLAQAIMGNAEKGSQQMDQMMDAVKEINHASQNISKVIKVIDDIAFQTNILALNAAVEAARAGQHGKGFAVVAEEVRSLAAKSAQAAKETGGLIANSMEKAELGSQIAGATAQSLSEIVSGISESTKIVGEIARSSDEQALAIGQVNTGIDQVAQVVQQNSATAEQSAAASQEMSGQSHALEELISQFKLNKASRTLPAGSRSRLNVGEQEHDIGMMPGSGGGNYGKY